MFAVKDDRSKIKLEMSGGRNWDGATVLNILKSVQPDIVPFLRQHATLARSSTGEKDATTTIRTGESGPEVNDMSDATANEQGKLTAHFHILTTGMICKSQITYSRNSPIIPAFIACSRAGP